MIELKGKYNTAKVFTDNVDEETIGQVINMMNFPFCEGSRIRIMPDTHAGKGCVIGTTMTIGDRIVPYLVGADIGCGILTTALEETDIDFEKFDAVVREYVPSGFSIHDRAIAKSDAAKINAPIDTERAYRSLGTLGGGNHFIEVDRDEDGHLYLLVHTGSRHLGIEVCDHYQKIAWETAGKLKEADNGQIGKATMTNSGKTRAVPRDLCHVEGQDFQDYIHDMKLAQDHAAINRETITEQIMGKMGLHAKDGFDTVHNYLDTDYMILRKGSVSARKGEHLVIPMNMRDGSLICEGKGNDDWNQSAPHGAGRAMSRSMAKDLVSLEEYRDSMAGIWTSSVSISTIDESPFAYKPAGEILECITDTVDVVKSLKPVYNFKASV